MISGLSKNVQQLSEQISKIKVPPAATQNAAPKTGLLLSGLLGLGSGAAISKYITEKKGELKSQGFSDEEINNAENVSKSISDLTERVPALNNGINEAKALASNTRAGATVNPAVKEHTENVFGLDLLTVQNYAGKINLKRNEKAVKFIQGVSESLYSKSRSQAISDVKTYREKYSKELKSTSTWALTAEYKPIQTGGLGDVPVELQNNFTNLDLDVPTFIPMYLKKNKSAFKMEMQDGKQVYTYTYNTTTFNLNKVAQMPITVYKNGAPRVEQVEFFTCDVPVPVEPNAPKKTKKLVFIKNNSFLSDHIYDANVLAEEPEKFAFFNKAVYQLANTKINAALGNETKCSADLQIFDKTEWNNLKPPVSMILNDWHAGTMAPLLRYKSSMEYAYGEIDDNAYSALRDMPLVMIGHNVGIQGNVNSGGNNARNKEVNENIINTLFDSYAVAITKLAQTKLPIDDLSNAILVKPNNANERQVNNLFTGVALSDFFTPVSKQYAKEICDTPLGNSNTPGSGIVWNLLKAKASKDGTVVGIVNGLDTKTSDTKNHKESVSKNLSFELKTYDKNTQIDDVMLAKAENKRNLYSAFIKKMATDGTMKVNNNSLSLLGDTGKFTVSEEDFMQAPLLSFAHRLTDQKGLKTFKGAMALLFENWEKDFGSLAKPVVVVGGQLVDSAQAQYLKELQEIQGGKDRILVMTGYMPNFAMMPCSDFFVSPSNYEPCGLTQGQSFAVGTIPITTRTGGFIDTVKNGVNGFLTKTEIAPATTQEQLDKELYETMVEALKVYHNDKDKYKQMVAADLQENLSWVRPNDQGPIFEYLNLLGLSREGIKQEQQGIVDQIAKEKAEAEKKAKAEQK
ncbi:MAG: glycogen/starch synthase [Candidatus Gastranaerophilales bacterium]|nr:glycogen/starch synthase [Candidatus Gastranaerophilales bacterium]